MALFGGSKTEQELDINIHNHYHTTNNHLHVDGETFEEIKK